MNKKIKLFLNSCALILSLSGVLLNVSSCDKKETPTVSTLESFKLSLKNHKDNTLATGEKDQIVINFDKDTKIDDKWTFTYESSDQSILSVNDTDGTLEALKEGSVEIKVTEKSSKVSEILNVTINEGDEEFSAFAPKGAPLLAVYDSVVNKKGFEVAGNNTDVPVQLKANKYNYIIFDSVSALKLTNGVKKADGTVTTATSSYTYYGLLTAGNFHLVSRKYDREPQKGDKILTFMKGQSPDMALKSCYKELFDKDNISNITYVQDNTKMPAALIAGQYEGNPIDYFLIAEPALTSAKSKITENNVIYDLNLNDKIKEITNGEFDYIPQAGLFVRNDYLKLKPNYVENYWKDVKNQMKNAYSGNIQELEKSINTIEFDKQAGKYGFDINLVKKLQSGGANKFGIANPDKEVTLSDINKFLEKVNADFQINK